MKEKESDTGAGDGGKMTFPLFVHGVLFILGLWGCLAIYNATVYGNAPYHFAVRQFIWLMIGMAIMYLSSKIDFRHYMRLAPYLALAFFIPLLLVLFLGVRINGMKGWFAFGSVFIQPSEIAKPVYVLSLCWICGRLTEGMKRNMLLALALATWIIPIAYQPDYGTLIIYLSGLLAVYLISGGSFLTVILSFIALVPAAAFIAGKKAYVLRRMVGFLDPSADPSGSGWHILQFQFTLARGGLFGADWGKCLWANSYLPLSYSDSAFASLTEAIGFAGVLPIIFGFAIFAYVGFKLAEKAEPGIRRIFICSMTSMITFQAFVHISVNVGLIPPTGITLPMFSYGGSSLVSTMLGAGLILSAANSPKGEVENGMRPGTNDNLKPLS